ncbi:MAG: class I SAM-dependent methyltransferase [Candidatus Neomarinimicrobiota bacterium]
MLDIAPLPSFQRYCLSSTGLKYQSIDVALPWTTIRADIRAAPYGDETFQVILCSHVLEHIPEDRVAMREIHRLLASGGFALIQVPIDGAETREDASISDPEERRRLYGQADHVRSYGMDVSVRLSQAGLRVEVVPYARQFSKAEQARYGLDPEEVLFVCHKD